MDAWDTMALDELGDVGKRFKGVNVLGVVAQQSARGFQGACVVVTSGC